MSNYIVANFDRREFLLPQAFGEDGSLHAVITSHSGVLSALAVLLADGNNRGGGDLRSDAEIIGSWAGCRIAIIDDLVTDARFSEAGLEATPLQQQLRQLGKDVSAAVNAAIGAAEGDWWTPSRFNAKHRLPMALQRKVIDMGGMDLLSADGRLKPIHTLESLFAGFGSPCPVTPYGAAKYMQSALDAMAPAFGLLNPWTVHKADFEIGPKQLRTARFSSGSDRQPSTGVVAISFHLEFGPTGEKRSVRLALDEKTGCSLDAAYRMFFPDISFEAAPALTDGITSPEVARLLKNIPLLDNQTPKG